MTNPTITAVTGKWLCTDCGETFTPRNHYRCTRCWGARTIPANEDDTRRAPPESCNSTFIPGGIAQP
jgi:DNA-directed RNA polymerase subunit RPC12/RpoP